MTTVLEERRTVDSGDSREAFHFQILGPLRLWRDGVEVDAGSRMQRSVLALLLARGGNPVSMSEMLDLLWGDEPPASAVNTVHKYLGTLRRVLQPGLGFRDPGRWLLRQGPGYRFNATPEALDLSAFRRAASAARRSLADGDDATALEWCVEALGLWQGPAGDGLAETPGAETILATLDREYLGLAVEAAQVARRQKRPQAVLDLLWQAVDIGPLHEPLHAELVANLALAGHHAEALGAYQAVRNRLDSELGIRPSPALQLAYRDIGATSERPVPRARGVIPRDDTWRWRPAQLPADLPFFVGRADLMSRVRGHVAQQESTRRTPAIVAFNGMPGVGKTAVALRLAHKLAPDYPDGQLHLDLRGFADDGRPATVEEALRDLISGLGVEQRLIPDGRQAMAGLFRTMLRDRRVLILLDDARSADQIFDLLPSASGCLALVTSRRQMLPLATGAGAFLVPVGLPKRAEARAYLLEHLRVRPVETDPQAVDSLIDHCGRLPLAIAYAGVRASAYPSVPLRDTVEVSRRADSG